MNQQVMIDSRFESLKTELEYQFRDEIRYTIAGLGWYLTLIRIEIEGKEAERIVSVWFDFGMFNVKSKIKMHVSELAGKAVITTQDLYKRPIQIIATKFLEKIKTNLLEILQKDWLMVAFVFDKYGKFIRKES